MTRRWCFDCAAWKVVAEDEWICPNCKFDMWSCRRSNMTADEKEHLKTIVGECELCKEEKKGLRERCAQLEKENKEMYLNEFNLRGDIASLKLKLLRGF
jgi:hypothetical protein